MLCVSSPALEELESGLVEDWFKTWTVLNLTRTEWNKCSQPQEGSVCTGVVEVHDVSRRFEVRRKSQYIYCLVMVNGLVEEKWE